MKKTKPTMRYDLGEFAKPIITDQGYLKADAIATRIGVFPYLQADGSVIRELRPADEVFALESLKTLQNIALTDDHPPEPLNSDNTDRYQAGHTGDFVFPDEFFVRTNLTVTKADVIQKMQQEGKVQLSCGYFADIDPTPGEFLGQRYDAIQRNIRYNHLAVVDRGRAGPDVKVRLDAGDAIMLVDEKSPCQVKNGSRTLNADATPKSKKESLNRSEAMDKAKFKIDGVEYEASEAVARLALDQATALEASKKEIETLKGRCDGLESDLAKKDEEIKQLKEDQPTDEQVMARAKSRLDLEGFAKTILGDDAKFDGQSDAEIKKAVLKKDNPDIALDEKSDDYVDARFDVMRENHEEGSEDPLKKDLKKQLNGDGLPKDAEKVRRDNMEKSKDAWKKGQPQYEKEDAA